jgi:glutamate synthase (NADPH/NADH) large chain
MWHERAEFLAQHGMYDPSTEHDACGVGMVAAIDGQPRREVVLKGIDALKAVWHRGAVDADGKTGDGAGINIQIPRQFFVDHIHRVGNKLTSKHLAIGMIFLPKKDLSAKEACRGIVEHEILKFGYSLYGWRQVPVNPQVIGEIANDSRPEIEQIMIGGKDSVNEEQFEIDLFIIRKRIEKAIKTKALNGFYICSFSCRSLIYKGLFRAEQLTEFYPDLLDERFVSNYAIFHQRFSTNTAPAWHLAQPFRMLAHNGEINTIKGNINFMRSHETNMSCPRFDGYMEDILPVIMANGSDTATLDNAVEMLVRAGRSLPLVKLILIPPVWKPDLTLPQDQRDMFNFLNSISEQWDGPAAIAGTDGSWVIAGMDRNGLRPMRYAITMDGLLLVGSESGMVPFDESRLIEKGRLGPGDIIGVNLRTGTLHKDQQLKSLLAMEYPYSDWVKNINELDQLLEKAPFASYAMPESELRRRQLATGLSMEEMELVLQPMAETGKEGVGSMGDDTPISILSHHRRGFHHYFRQNFSQVTNPPIDSLRERRVMSLNTRFGNNGNMLAHDDSQSRTLLLSTPVVLNHEVKALEDLLKGKTTVISTLFPVAEPGALEASLQRIQQEAEQAVLADRPYLILTDEGMNREQAAIPAILAVGAVHTHLVRKQIRKPASLIVRSAECLDVHHFAVLIGVGATVVNAYLAEESIAKRHARKLFGKLTLEECLNNYKKAASDGLLKIMSKMGISVISAYRGGYNFEALGLSRSLMSQFFPGMPSRLSGIGLTGIEKRIRQLHQKAWETSEAEPLPVGGFYRYRAREEKHAFEGQLIHLLQTAVDKGAYALYKKYSEGVHQQGVVNLRDLLDFDSDRKPIDVEKVESITEIRKRFIAPAMSLGALSPEAHETLAIAMNRMGAASNSGEGGEDISRATPYSNGDNANSTIKQIASGRFGVTAEYLNNARELQIKVAQGAKPGEGGQLPGFKVTELIAKLRHSTPGVTLISPPPHHDIYSIEDLAQLIYDLKQINPRAIVSVKLVSQSGIGTIASGVAKAMADKIVISGHTGGTGASPYSSIKFAGIPWEMGLAEANQVLTMNRLRHRVKLQTDGGLKTGRDIVIAALLGAEEYAVGTASLVAMGCIMVRQCHSNTCPVGICTQDPKLRAKFEGSVEKVVNLFSFIAEEVREILAKLGYSTLDEIIGRSDLLVQVNRGGEDMDIDLNPLLALADPGLHPRYCTLEGRNEVPDTLDAQMIKDAREALERGEKIQLAYNIQSTQRTIGARLSSMMVRRFDTSKLQPDHITLRLRGSAGQSLGAFAVRGLKIEVLGDANDYVGKGLSGGMITLRPRPSSPLIPHENTILGNTVLYGATAGKVFAAGQAGERFAVRNSGATAVIEGCGSNGCEYMTGGTVVILGKVGDNFGAGMTGGMVYLYDPENSFEQKVNPESLIYQRIANPYWESQLKRLIEEHVKETDSMIGQTILAGWEWELPHFWQVCPKEVLALLPYPLTNESEETSLTA